MLAVLCVLLLDNGSKKTDGDNPATPICSTETHAAETLIKIRSAKLQG
jgi:hypothetical protein